MNLLINSKKLLTLLLTIAVSTQLISCVSILDAATDKPIQTDPSKRTFGQYLDDEELERIVAVNIRKASPALDNESHINVNIYNSVVLLTGEVPTQLAKDQASAAAKKVNRVRQVHNELTVGPNSRFRSRVQDNWFQSKVKTRLVTDYEIDSDRIEIIVENDVVFLMGLVKRKEAERVTELARTTKGVKKVVRVFEYLD